MGHQKWQWASNSHTIQRANAIPSRSEALERSQESVPCYVGADT